MTGAIAMGTSKITGLGDPTAAQDAATKNYVDNAGCPTVDENRRHYVRRYCDGSFNNITGLATIAVPMTMLLTSHTSMAFLDQLQRHLPRLRLRRPAKIMPQLLQLLRQLAHPQLLLMPLLW